MNCHNANERTFKNTISPVNPTLDLHRYGQTDPMERQQERFPKPDLPSRIGRNTGLCSATGRVADRRAPTLLNQPVVGVPFKYPPTHRLHHLCRTDLGGSFSKGPLQLCRDNQQFGMGRALYSQLVVHHSRNRWSLPNRIKGAQ